jgi:hypothetical protein
VTVLLKIPAGHRSPFDQAGEGFGLEDRMASVLPPSEESLTLNGGSGRGFGHARAVAASWARRQDELNKTTGPRLALTSVIMPDAGKSLLAFVETGAHGGMILQRQHFQKADESPRLILHWKPSWLLRRSSSANLAAS